MITWVTIGGKRHAIETNARGDIIKKDGKPIDHSQVRDKTVHELQMNKIASNGFMQRGSNKRR